MLRQSPVCISASSTAAFEVGRFVQRKMHRMFDWAAGCQGSTEVYLNDARL